MKYPKKYINEVNNGSVDIGSYGFTWDNEVLVERTAANRVNPKFKVLRVYATNGDVVEILMRPKSTKVELIKRKDRIVKKKKV